LPSPAADKIRVEMTKAKLGDINQMFAGLRAGTVNGQMVMML
jgi:D-arabinose 1-dehydrogenase-like Zn-dependent alcohol dehydrogenase